MEFTIIKNKKVPFQDFFKLPEILFLLTILLLVILKVLGYNKIIPKEVFYAIFIIIGILFFIKEQFLIDKMYLTIGKIVFLDKVTIRKSDNEYKINYNEIKSIYINFDNYRHWVTSFYLLTRQSGAYNSISIKTNGKSYAFNFLSTSHKDQKRIRLFCYKLKNNNIPIEYVEKGNTIIPKERKISN